MYVGGYFSTIGGSSRSYIAALDATTGSSTAWNANANGSVEAFDINNGKLYVGGRFTSIGGQSRNRVASFELGTGSITSWNPNASDRVYSISSRDDYVYVGGRYSSINNLSVYYISSFYFGPAAPSGLTGTATANAVTLNWTDNAAGESGYNIDISTDGVNFIDSTSVAANSETATIGSLSPETNYFFRVATAYDLGESPNLYSSVIRTDAAPADDSNDSNGSDDQSSGSYSGLPDEAFIRLTAPVGGFLVYDNQDGKVTRTREVIMNFNVSNDVRKVAISLTGDYTDSIVQEYQPEIKIDLCSKFAGFIQASACPDGDYTVHAKFYTIWGTPSGTFSHVITLKANEAARAKIMVPQTAIKTEMKIVAGVSKISAGAISQNLRYGSKGAQVIMLQNNLKKIGYFPESIVVNGNYGPTTRDAVKKFQCEKMNICSGSESNGYGLIGPKTREALSKIK